MGATPQPLSPSPTTSTTARGYRCTNTSHLTSCLLLGAVYLPRAYGVGHPRGYPAHAMTDPTPLPPMNHPTTAHPKGTAARPLRPPTTCAPPGWAMPPLTLAGQRYAPRATEFCIDPATTTPPPCIAWSLSLCECTRLRQGPRRGHRLLHPGGTPPCLKLPKMLDRR